VQEVAASKSKRWSRVEVAQKMAEYEQGYQQTPNQRQWAEELEIPRTTLQHWLMRRDSIDADPELVAFLESSTGVAFLHRLVLAAQFVITLLGPGGIRLVCLFLELSGLDQFVAASYGSQQKVTVAMEEALVEFGRQEQQRLGKDMEPKQITVCEDETFHPAVCLVAIEPVSNFILLEQYADNRQAETWTSSLAQATAGLSIKIVQSTSDEGRGLLRHVEVDLGAHHSPDVFHVQHELVKASSGALASKRRQAEQTLQEVTQQLQAHQQTPAACPEAEGPEDPPALMAQAQAREQVARQALETAAERQEQVRQARQGIGSAYHPYDLESGAARSAEQVSVSLEQYFAAIETVATAAELSESCFKRIAKAKRVVGAMVATMAFFWLTVRAKIQALSLTPQVERALYDNLIPGIYLHLVSEKAQDAAQRHTLQQNSEVLLAPLRATDGPLRDIEPEEKSLIERVALECAHLFQRSSSCVEGRNGLLALYHHSLHRISNRKLAALTTIHNYFVTHDDATTAAERFFGAKPKNLFEWLLDRVDLPGRPAQKRSQPQRKEYLVSPAA
jgi:hypothetical protein